MSDPFENVSDVAKAVGAACFAMMRVDEGELRFAMKEHRPSPKTQSGLDELVGAGIIARTDYPDGSVTYVPKVSCYNLLSWSFQNRDKDELSFPLTDRIKPSDSPAMSIQSSYESGKGETRNDEDSQFFDRSKAAQDTQTE